MNQRLKSFWQDDSGATSIEYAVIGAVISIAVIGTLQMINTSLAGFFSLVANSFPG